MSGPAIFRVALLTAAFAIVAHGQGRSAPPNLTGSYRCEPQPRECQSETFSITQSGADLEFASEKGDRAHGQLTSDSTISVAGPWNMLGVIYDGAIEWSNGTKWQKR
jgi:hypothetical protein